MFKLGVELHEDVTDIIYKIKDINDAGIELEIPEGATLLENILNLRLIQEVADDYGKVIHFSTKDENGQNLLNIINESESSDFVSKEQFLFATDETQSLDSDLAQYSRTQKKAKLNLKAGLVAFTNLVQKIKIRRVKKMRFIILILLILGGIAFAGYQALYKIPSATVKITVNSQPLTKSVQMKVVKDGQNSAAVKTLKGYGVENLVSKTASIETTGEKLVGEKATGEVRIFNKTLAEKEFEEGEIVSFDNGETEFEFILDENLTVPAAVENETGRTYGEAVTTVTAADIGSDYNIDQDSSLTFEEYDSGDFSAEAVEDFSGGSSETVKIVTQEDKDALIAKVNEETTPTIDDELTKAVNGDRKYIKGSATTVLRNQLFSAEIDDEADTLELTQEVTATGLAYSQKDLDELLDDLLDEFIPNGYALSSEDKELKVEVLGNSETTVASSIESDLQVTIKAFVVPNIAEDEIKQKLVGQSLSNAQKVLGSIQNIKNYELNVSPNIPFLQRMPQNADKITLEIAKE